MQPVSGAFGQVPIRFKGLRSFEIGDEIKSQTQNKKNKRINISNVDLKENKNCKYEYWFKLLKISHITNH